ncbi:AI-2E family transporter [Accumulibacter sp.]|uniref:AI-2E family transporter n=1 Tax=Accumulibacter sp. TaxID=2053492 RepID=UPI0025F7A71C|nr:AI-2E family transporter [Accumulibacter sp.]MCM8594774.1 AI-2E family transporter [Accumulibacter sp.]MDS4048919.1 AI-2E family transporter [Accumulibacter sp.]
MARLQGLVHGAVLMLITGWLLYIGKDVLVPVFLGLVVVYVIVGLAQALHRVPYLGRVLPLQVRYALSVLAITLALLIVIYLFMINKDRFLALAPQYQQSLLTAIQRLAVFLRIETEPTWTTLRQELFAQINIQRLFGSMLASVSSIVVSVIVVFLYVTFLFAERRFFARKMESLSSDAGRVARVRAITADINQRIGSYLALKTFISLFLGATSWIVMAFAGLELAAFWAVLIAFLNYVPYLGSFLGVLFPVIMAIIQFEDPDVILWVFLGLVIVQFLIGNFLDPYLMGSSLNLSPFAILVSLAIWSELWGIAGAFLAVPITAVLAIIFSEFLSTRPIAVLLSRNGRL